MDHLSLQFTIFTVYAERGVNFMPNCQWQTAAQGVVALAL